MFSINIGMFTSFLNTLAITTVFSISFVFTSLGAEELPPDQINNSNLRTSFIKTRDELNKKTIPITVASLTDRLLFHPPETVITLQQSYVRESFKKINFFQAVQRLYQSEGALGFYKGFFWPTASAIPTRYTVFGSYYAARRLLEDLPPYQRYLYSGVIAGLVKSIIQCPSEAERVRKVCNIKVENRLMPKNFFKGLFPLCLKHLFSVTPALGGSDVVFLHFNTVKEHPLGPFVTASSLSFMFQIIATPMDMLKTRVMEDYTGKSLKTHLIQLNSERRMIYRTFWPIAIRSSVGSGVMIGVIHLVERML